MTREDYELVETYTDQCNMVSDFWYIKFKDGKKPTVDALVEYILTDMSIRYTEWGQILLDSFIGDIVLEYEIGKVVKKDDLKYASIKTKKVEDVVAFGKWSRMDWILRKLS